MLYVCGFRDDSSSLDELVMASANEDASGRTYSRDGKRMSASIRRFDGRRRRSEGIGRVMCAVTNAHCHDMRQQR